MTEQSPLETEIRRLIGLAGPMPVSEFMDLCLGHPQLGYYVTHDPFGASGDFTTAPEISQMFGELLGLWAAEKLGITGAAAEAYAKEVVMADFEEAGDDDVFRKVRKDFDDKGVKESDHQIRRTMDELMARAITEIKASG